MWHCPLRNPATCLTSPPRCPLGIWNFTLSKQNYWLPTPKIQLLSQMLSLLSFSFQEVPTYPGSHMLSGTLYTPPAGQPVTLLLTVLSSTGLFLTSRRLHISFVLVLSHQTAAPATAPHFLSFKPQFKWISERLFWPLNKRSLPSHSGTSHVIFKAFVTTWYLNTYLQFISP